ncbi:hypothetical protein N7G274_001458 [Stereocaulon virgatum]|uniref:Uncharacterized protein n=1 Tax=Stereocaulon virgatum TaxID=373712 RepID=A0ABR4AME9_9LECA
MKISKVPSVAVLFQLFVLRLNAAIPVPSMVPTIHLHNSTADNLALPVNTTASKATNDLPPTNPWRYRVPHTSLDVNFFYLRIEIEETDALAAILEAANDIISQLSTTGDKAIGQGQLGWDTPTVRLTLRPEPVMTWVMWGATLKALTHFANAFDSISYLYDVSNNGQSIGGGTLVLPKPGDSKQNSPATS